MVQEDLTFNSSISESIKKSNKKPAFIPFIVSGFPDLNTTKELLYVFQENGAAAIELGIPFSDPLADGFVIQNAAKHAIDNGINLDKIFSLLDEIKTDFKTPLILFSYFNPILNYGIEKFVNHAKELNVSGLIIPDLPVEESEYIWNLCKINDINFIMLVTPTSGKERIEKIAAKSSGFIYLVSSTGVTGIRDNFSDILSEIIAELKTQTDIPIAVGFGVSQQEHIRILEKLNVDGAIIGSAIIKLIEQYKNDKKLLVTKVSEYINYLYSKD